ncbi:RHS repeat-associated core domain-containing protein [Chryseobacterium koreense]|uniref:RHS repeat-associated core domain-containing protein n=1 Tax=Chryseobacterium koreense TaxID=232216 RepID=UPI0026EBBF9F|nr:RHS repeat-associated core domain-containing protein [Chryseobacterium koreense]
MRLFLFFLSIFLFGNLVNAQEQVSEIPLRYDVSGYLENSENHIQNKTSDPLTPTVNAEMNVSDGGALTYVLPIELLKGVNSFQPNIAIAYNSQSGNGMAGWGWNIVGLSTITRGGKSKEVDGITIGPQFNDSDPFYLDGQRLIRLNDSQFATEKFSKIRITKYATGEYSFVVQYTDGKISKYRELTSGQHYISTMLDSYGNQIHYTYEVSGRVPVLTKVSYGGTSSGNDKFFIDLFYKNRKYPIKIYRNNFEISNTKVLSHITVNSSYDGLFRKYSIVHDFIENNTAERIREIHVENKNGEELKPISFAYNNSTYSNIKITSVNNNGLNPESYYGYGHGANTAFVKGLGSVSVGNFTGKDNVEAIYQVKLSNNTYQIKSSAAKYIGATSIDTNSNTNFYSGKILDNGEISETDHVITVDVNYLDQPNLEDPSSPANFNLRDEIVFRVKNFGGGQEKISFVLKGSLIEKDNYHPPVDPYLEPDANNQNNSAEYIRNKDGREFFSGDFNNDGLIDFIVAEEEGLNRPKKLYFLEVGKKKGELLDPAVFNGALTLTGKEVYPIEFDGDGLPELMAVTKYSGNYDVYKIDFSTNTISNIYANQTLSNFGYDTPIYFGDFNGDGLTDFITPQTVYKVEDGEDDNGAKLGAVYNSIQRDKLYWWKYTSTGTQFLKQSEDYTEQKIFYVKPSQNNVIKRSTFWEKFWNGKPDEYAFTRYSTHSIFVTDFDGDGRSDIITLNKLGRAKYTTDGKLASTTIENLGNDITVKVKYKCVKTTYPFNTGYFAVDPSDCIAPYSNAVPLGFFQGAFAYATFQSPVTNQVNLYLNKNLEGNTFVKQASESLTGISISPLSLILGQTNFNRLNTFQAGVFIHDPLTAKNTSIIIDNSGFLEKQIQEVNNGSTVVQKVDYRNMRPSETNDEATYVYEPANLKYPYYTHRSNGLLYLVNKIHTVFDDKVLTKEYRFENGVQHLEGKGFLGFTKTYVSDAFESTLKNGKYIIKDPFKAVFWNIQTRDPLMENSVIKSTYGGLKKFFTETTSVNMRFERGNHQYLILSTNENSKDNLKKITITKTYDYDESDDLKLKTAYADYSGAGTTVSKYTYKPEFNDGDHYQYGKIASIENSTYKDGLSFTTKEISDYNSKGAVSESYKYSNDANAPPIVTSYTYDAVGNILSQTSSVQGITPQTTTYEYDATQRYVAKTTAPDGLSSTSVVNALGRVSEETSPLNLKTYYTYDNWGNITEITDYLGKKTTISKAVSAGVEGGIYDLSKKREGGIETIVTFDRFDREIQSKTQSINGKWLVVNTKYDIFGRKTEYSEPHFEGETAKWNQIKYDELSRPIENKSFTGKSIKTCYEGMKITVDDGYKKTSKTLDAMGNTVRQQDHGGIIGYSYYPNGALRETNYEGIKTKIEIDGWGNKTKIIDPSAGTFTYQYDNIGRLTREDNPKGYTEYTYDALGRPLTEKTYGKTTAENTTIEKAYTYNATTKLPETVTGKSNGQTFTYTTYYDQYYRITGKKEETPDFTYTSTTTFDSFGRADVVSVSTTLNSPSLTSASSVKNVYDENGILIQQNNNATGAMVWHVSDIDARGQTKQLEYGNGYTVTNAYRATDFSLTKIKHQNSITGVSVLDVDYNYDVDKGVLLSRKNNTFSREEKFTYDTLNRLLTETVNSVLVNEYTYDKRGRITSNTELGKYNYNESDYKLQNIAFNASGQSVNTHRGFATISYNAFKSPLNISLPGKDNLTFEYNILKSRYKMTSSVTGIIKLYSSDFAVEITKNGGRTEITTYITGDPYSANYIKKTSLYKNNRSEANYYLHRDNLGSILAITDADGAAVEKRYFDAWGNLKAITDADEQLITDENVIRNLSLFIDRGYTGHEHLQNMGLINMNARIYDPILRKFLSPDNYVQDPFNTQNYDRYSYVLNNPLLYIDPSGNEILIGTAILIGIAVGIMANGIANMINGIPFWYGMGKAGVMGGVTAAISFGIGSMATDVFGALVSVGKATFEAGMHAFTGGWISAIDGGSFGSGFWSGLVSSVMASGVSALGINFGASTRGNVVYNGFGKDFMKATMVVAGGFSGGISASIAGGNFWQGFRQGIITSGLNHVAHMTTEFLQRNDPNDPTTWTRKYSLDRAKELYPRFYEVLTKLQDFLQANPKVLSTLSEDTGLTKAQVLKFMDIKSPEGQVIVEAQMKNLGQSGYPRSFINKDLITTFETLQTPAYIQGTSFLLAVTVLHEFVHWGRAYNILPSDSKGTKYSDYGSQWEYRTFGDVTGKNQATINLSYQYGWKF